MASQHSDCASDEVRSKTDYHSDVYPEEVQSKAQQDHPEPRNNFEAMVLEILGDLQDSMQSMKDRVIDLEEAQAQSAGPASIQHQVARSVIPSAPSCEEARNLAQEVQSTEQPTLSPAANGTSRHWSDRDDENMDYAAVTWDIDPDEEFQEGKGIKLFKVTQKTEQFIITHFTAGVSNQTRRQWRDKYGAPVPPPLPVQAWTKSSKADCLQWQSHVTDNWLTHA